MAEVCRTASRRGANAVEFALTFPVFLLVFFAVFEFGMFYMHRSVAESAVIEACREASILDPNVISLEDVALKMMSLDIKFLGQKCDRICAVVDSGSPPFRRLECSIAFKYEPILQVIPTPELVSVKSIARLEWQRVR